MSYVQDYTRDQSGKTSLFDIKICPYSSSNCNVLTHHYLVKNAAQTRQYFPFPSTPDNTVFFIPDRILQDPRAMSNFVIPHATQQECFNIDPCDLYASSYCCKNKQNTIITNTKVDDGVQPKSKTPVTTSSFILFIVLLILAMFAFLGLCFGAMKYFSK